MKTNYFGDFEYYAEINGDLFELTPSYFFSRNVKRYNDSYCFIGKDFVHPDRNINPCIKMSFAKGSHLIKITLHHTRPYKGVSDILLKDGDGNIIVTNKLLPGDIFNYEIKIKRDAEFDLYFTVSSHEITHALVRTIIETNEIDFDGDLNINLNKTNWVIKETNANPPQDVRVIEYDTEYKY